MSRNDDIYTRRMNKETFSSIANLYGISRGRAAEIFRKEVFKREQQSLFGLAVPIAVINSLRRSGCETIEGARRIIVDGTEIRNFGTNSRLQLAVALLKKEQSQ